MKIDFDVLTSVTFDVCLACMKPHLSDGNVHIHSKRETTLLARKAEKPTPQSKLKHEHFVASVKYICDACGDNEEVRRKYIIVVALIFVSLLFNFRAIGSTVPPNCTIFAFHVF